MILEKLVGGEELSAVEAEGLMDSMMEGRCTDAQAGALLTALRMKGESVTEIASLARAMRRHAIAIHPQVGGLVDTCGTGGDGSCSFNVSTAAALIAAGAGIAVAKHGNRAISGKCGSADVLEQLGVRMLAPKEAETCIERNGISFLFAPLFHPAMKNAAAVRRELGIRTVFNILGPLANPAGAKVQVMGVYSPELTERLALVLHELGAKRALIVHSEGMDELGLGKSRVSELRGGAVDTYSIDAADFGLKKRDVPIAHNAEEGAAILLGVLKGEKGAARDMAALNAAAAIYASGASGDVAGAMEKALSSIDSGAALNKLEALRAFGRD